MRNPKHQKEFYYLYWNLELRIHIEYYLHFLCSLQSPLILSKNGDGYPVALKLAEEGHVVRIFIEEDGAKDTGKSLKNPKTIPYWRPYIESSDLIFADMVGFGSEIDKLAERGRVVFGGGRLADKLELDRVYASKVVEELTEVQIPPSEKVTDKKALMSLLEEATEPKVLKPLNNKETRYTLVAGDGSNEDLKSIIPNLPEDIFPMLVQDKIEGTEISTEGWFDGEEFILPFNHTIEHKRLMEGDKGAQTGCMGNVVWFTEGDEITEKGLLPLQDLLKEANYVGPIDMNCLVNETGIHFLEFTTRFGYDAIQAFTEGLRMPLFEVLYGIALKTLDRIKTNTKYNIAVRLSMPPYPFQEKTALKELKGRKVLTVPNEAKKHIWLADTLDGEVLAGIDGVIGCITAYGDTVGEARRRVYRTIQKNVLSQEVQYRSDIGVDFEEKLRQLTKLNILSKKQEEVAV